MGCPITAELVGDQAVGDVAQPLQQLAKEAFGRPCIAAFLHENIQNLTVLIHRSSQVVSLPSDANEQFVEMPRVSWLSASTSEFLSERLAKLETPEADRFMTDGHAAFG